MRRIGTLAVLAVAAALVAATGGCGGPYGRAALKWEELPTLPDRFGFAGAYAGVSGGVLLVAGGANFPGGRPWEGHQKTWHSTVFSLADPRAGWGMLGEALPRPLAYGVALTWRDALLCIGGGDDATHYPDAFLAAYYSGRLRITDLPPMPGPAAFFCGALIGDTVYVAGGRATPDSPRALKTFWALDLSAPTSGRKWRELEPWPGPPRMLAVAASLNGSFYLISGVDLVPGAEGKPTRVYLTDAYRYTPGKGWASLADVPRPAAAAPTPAPTLGAATILVLGGDDGSTASRADQLKDRHPGFRRDILAYDTATDTWTTRGAMPKTRGPDPASNPNAALWPPVTTPTTLWRGRIVVPTGEARPGVRTPRVLWASPVDRR